jgi:ABC-2 type transport system ATP-binding protein
MEAISAVGLGRRYGRRWALRDCTVAVPVGRVVGLVGTNGAGKSTLLNLAMGLVSPSAGTIEVLGEDPAESTTLGRVGFVAQSTPLYESLTVGEHLRLGRVLNRSWDDGLAAERIRRLGLDVSQRAGGLSGGQRAQLALTLAIGKRPDLLLLDEPVATLDPLARRHFQEDLMSLAVAGTTMVVSSHLLADIERTCDYLIVMRGGVVALAGEVEEVLANHKVLVGARCDARSLPAGQHVVQISHTVRQTTALVRCHWPATFDGWSVGNVGLEDLVLAYMGEPKLKEVAA